MSELARVSLSIEEPLLKSLEKLTRASGYENRSEFIRDMIRDRLTLEEWKSGADVIGTVTLIYNHHHRGLTEKLVELQHDSLAHVLVSTHVHISHEICAEMIMVRGNGEKIRQFAGTVKRQKGVLHAELSMSTTGENIS